jgi:hypothetical protein
MIRLLFGCICFGLSAGLISDAFFLSRWAAIPPVPAIAIGILASVAVSFLVFRRLAQSDIHHSAAPALLTILFLAVSVYVGWLVVIGYFKFPHGEWDAWAIWNLHGRFLYRAGENWRDMFAAKLYWTHPDYPPLLPSLVAAVWTLIGKESVTVPALIAMAFTFGTLALLVSSVSLLWNGWRGIAAGFLFFTAPDFFAHGSYQMADVPFSFFILLTVVLLYLNDRISANGLWLVLAGAAAGFAATTKNEGLLFVVAIIAARLLIGCTSKPMRAVLNEMQLFACGLAPSLAIVLGFKFLLSPSNDIFHQPAAFWSRVVQPARYATIAENFIRYIAAFGAGRASPFLAAGAYILHFGWGRSHKSSPAQKTTIALLLFMLAGYFAVYVVTPNDLQWHLDSSFPRLLLHLWPTFVFCVACAGLRIGAEPRVEVIRLPRRTKALVAIPGAAVALVLGAAILRSHVPVTARDASAELSRVVHGTTMALHLEQGSVLVELGESPSTTSGHAQFEPTPSDVSTSGLAFLIYRAGASYSESTVPATMPVNSGFLLYQYGGGFRTSVSITNPGTASADMVFANKGTTLNVKLSANHQISVFLDEAPFFITSPEGILEFRSSAPVVVSSLLTFSDRRYPFVMANMPVGDATRKQPESVHIPYILTSPEWSSRLILANPTSGMLRGNILWYSEDGKSRENIPYFVSPHSVWVAEPVAAAAVRVTRAKIVPAGGTVPPNSTAVMFRHEGPQQAIVTMSAMAAAAESHLFVETSGTISTDIVVANPENRTFMAKAGSNSEWMEFAVPAASTVTLPLTGYPMLKLAGGGLVNVVAQSPLLVAAVRRMSASSNGQVVTTYNANLRHGLLFPTLANGDGFTTQFAVFNDHNRPISGILRFFDQVGRPLDLPLIRR